MAAASGLLLCICANAQFVGDVTFDYYFDNREFDAGENAFTHSMTIHALRFSPAVGYKVGDKSLSQSIMVGSEVLKNMGGDRPSTDLTLYYNLNARGRRDEVKLYAGLVPKRLLTGEYNEAFMSDSQRFFDAQMEGMLVQWKRRNFVSEFGADWMGMIGTDRRERFKLFAYAEYSLSREISFGVAFDGYHYANALNYGGVMDQNLLEPFVKMCFVHGRNGSDGLSLRASWLVGIQRDRGKGDAFVFPNGLRLELNASTGAFYMRNIFYTGGDMMPMYDGTDAGGYKYGHDLYWGSPFYRTQSSLDRFELGFEPHRSRYASLKTGFRFYFADGGAGRGGFGFQGWQQCVSLIFRFGGSK